jgi:hypothetical protein
LFDFFRLSLFASITVDEKLSFFAAEIVPYLLTLFKLFVFFSLPLKNIAGLEHAILRTYPTKKRLKF